MEKQWIILQFLLKKGFDLVHIFFTTAMYNTNNKPQGRQIMDTYENNIPEQEPNFVLRDDPDEISHTQADITSEAFEPVDTQAPADEYPPCQESDFHTDPIPDKRRKKKSVKPALSWLLIITLILSCCSATAYGVYRYHQIESAAILQQLQAQIKDLQEEIKKNSFTGNGNSVSGTPNVSADGLTPGQVYAKCADSVVAIVAASNTSRSSGSGFIITADGYVLTNYHVVEGSTLVTVTMHDGTTFTASAVGYDGNHDIALLKIDATDLPAADIGKSSELIVGDQVVAIGNPLGDLTSTLTVGYISAKERDVTTDGSIINMLQTDAAINSGNSGGPLFNMKGQVVGITTAKYSGTTTSGASIEGIGFAIPIDDISDKIRQIKENGYVSTPYMGVSVDNRNTGFGAYVVSVEKDGAAAAAGIQAGDLIMAIDDYEVTSVETLTRTLGKYKVGDTATVTVLRGRKMVELTITFKEKPQPTANQIPNP